MGEDSKIHRIGTAQMDRRRFIQRAAVTAATVPTIMTLTATGALAAACSAPAARDDGCNCTQTAECTAPATCAAGKCCLPSDAPLRSGQVCPSNKNYPTCCSGRCKSVNNPLGPTYPKIDQCA